MLWRMNTQGTRKKPSITNKSKGLQYIRELIVNLLKRVELFAAIVHRHSGLPKSNDRDLFGALNDDDKRVNTGLFESKPGIIKFVNKSTHP